jgi:hypothetical protein
MRFQPATPTYAGPRAFGYPIHRPGTAERLTAIEDGLAAAILQLDEVLDRFERHIAVIEGRRAA